MNAPVPLAPRRRDRQRVETHNRIFAAALAEFRRGGFANAQVTKIAEAAGVAQGTFFFHFPTKEHVLLELQSRGEANIIERLRALHRKPTSLKTFLHHVVDAILAEEVAVGSDLLRELLAVHVRRPPTLDSRSEPLAVAIQHFLAEAARRGEIRSDLSAEELTSIFFASIFGLLLAKVDSPAKRRPTLLQAVAVFVRGIAP